MSEAALLIGIFHVGIVPAFIVWEPNTLWIASNAADQVVHASTAVTGIATGLMTPNMRPDS